MGREIPVTDRSKNLRRGLLLLLAAALLLTAAVPALAVSVSDFKDVSQGAWYYDAVSFVTARGLFNGTSATAFTPNGTMTRGMFITVLGRYAGVDPEAWCAGTVTGAGVALRSGAGTSYSPVATLSKNTSVTIAGKSGDWYYVKTGGMTGYVSASYIQPKYHRFNDVDYGAYYAGYAIWGFEKGIVNGMGSADVFAPGSNVTREQICKLLKGYADTAGLTLSGSGAAVTFTDAASISSWAKAGVSAMQSAGVVMGEVSGSGYRFRPGSNATRAEAATIFQRFAGATGGGTSSGGESPAVQIGGSIAVKNEIIRVGILANTQNYRYAVASVKLDNTNGTSFEYGTFGADRRFIKSGTIASATITVTTNGSTFTVKNAAGTVVYTGGGNLAIHPVSSGKALTRVNGNYRYFGDFELRQAYGAAGYISVVNYLNLEDYVKGVIPYECSPSWPMETLKAAAVAARNVAMTADWNSYAAYGLDVMANTSLQTYRGRGVNYTESYFAVSDAAADATKGLYLTYKDGNTYRLCTCFYFSSDGGATEDSGHVFMQNLSYLVGKKDPYEAAAASLAGSTYLKIVTASRTGSALSTVASRAGLGSAIAPNGIKIETYPATGNVKSIVLTGTNGRTVTIGQNTSYTRWNFLRDFGFTGYSYNFEVSYNAAADTFTCTRHGWGHNVGMSQWGAYSMAKNYGKNYKDILGFYYTGTYLQYGAYAN